MNAINFTKKINKLIQNPNLFFYDFFRKKVYSGVPEKTKKVVEKVKANNEITVDIAEINRLGLAEYLRKNLKAGIGTEDGFDSNSLLIWSGYLTGLIHLISNIKNALSMNVTIYTLGGGYNLTAAYDENFDILSVIKKLSSRPDFVIELSNQIGDFHVIHFYLYDINEEHLAAIRSNRALVRKCPIDEIDFIFSNNTQSYNEKIDAVYTWVNQADPVWQKLWLETFPDEAFDPDRFTNNEELKYSLRSLQKYAPWLNKIFIVSNCEKPTWLNDFDKIIWINHHDIFPENAMLPTFNSHAIECCLHNIPELAEKFIYMNDDFILSQPCLPRDFFDETGRSISYFEPYGMVTPETQKIITKDYLLASINSNKLLKNKYKNYNARNLHRHVPYCLKKSILKEIESIFPKEFYQTRHAKLRSNTDINLTSFLYHHYAYINGKSVKSDLMGMIVRPENIATLINKDSYKYKILCFNDGNGSSGNEIYKKLTRQFFDKRLAEIAPWEAV